ncbi:MAG: enoyl-CoA hydratase/isomerase family protein [Desulforegulaceae bacterium]|nr:enoyl-CoA hydratase/isomerase family protein [Desulforegulaceae bacterium]
MTAVKWEKNGNVAIVTMSKGENRHNDVFAREMLKVLDEVVDDKEVKSIVLTSSDSKSWSLGIDVEWILGKFGEKDFQAIKDFMYQMNEVFKKLLLLPVPVIAAINGHAFGNGAILSCACDFRMMRKDRGYFCFPEVDLGIPFLPGMIAFVKKAFPHYKFNEMKLTGRRAGAVELEESHVLEKACENPEELLKEAIEFAKTFDKKRGIFAEHKKRLHKEIINTIDKEDPPVIESLKLFIQD